MSDQSEKPFSFAMTSALQAVARMQCDSSIIWVRLASGGHDDRTAVIDEHDLRQGSKPNGR